MRAEHGKIKGLAGESGEPTLADLRNRRKKNCLT
jgi:hypothetical protein